MAFGNLGQKFTALEIYDLVRKDLEKVEKEITEKEPKNIDTKRYVNILECSGNTRGAVNRTQTTCEEI